MSFYSTISGIKTIITGLVANKVANFSYTDAAYTGDDVTGVTVYDVESDMNVPVGTSEAMDLNSTILNKGMRAQVSSLPRDALNHLFGRISYNLNKLVDKVNNLTDLIARTIIHNAFEYDENAPYILGDICYVVESIGAELAFTWYRRISSSPTELIGGVGVTDTAQWKPVWNTNAMTASRQVVGSCATAQATIEKAIILKGFRLTAGAKFSSVFTYGCVAGAQVNVNATGPKTLYVNGAPVVDSTWAAGDIVDMMYDGLRCHVLNVKTPGSDMPKFPFGGGAAGVSPTFAGLTLTDKLQSVYEEYRNGSVTYHVKRSHAKNYFENGEWYQIVQIIPPGSGASFIVKGRASAQSIISDAVEFCSIDFEIAVRYDASAGLTYRVKIYRHDSDYSNITLVAWVNGDTDIIFLLKNAHGQMHLVTLDMSIHCRGIYAVSSFSPLQDNTYYTALESGYVEEEIQETRIITDNESQDVTPQLKGLEYSDGFVRNYVKHFNTPQPGYFPSGEYLEIAELNLNYDYNFNTISGIVTCVIGHRGTIVRFNLRTNPLPSEIWYKLSYSVDFDANDYSSIDMVVWYNEALHKIKLCAKNNSTVAIQLVYTSFNVDCRFDAESLDDVVYDNKDIISSIPSGYVEEAGTRIEYLTNNYLQGFSETGRHKRYSGDLNDILWNSTYNFSQADTSNYPSDLETNRWAFITTMVHQVSTNYATQVCYSMDPANRDKAHIWMRHRSLSSGTWFSWDKVLTENTIEKVPIGQFKLEGTGLSISTGYPALAAMDSTHVAFIDRDNDQLRMYVWSGSAWSLEGTGLSISGLYWSALAAMDSTHVAFIDEAISQLRMYVWSGSAWSLEGTGLSISGTNYPALAAMDSTHVAFIDSNNDQLRMYVWNGSTWSQEGTGLSISVGIAALAAMDSTHVAFIDSGNNQLRMYVWSGSAWSLEGTGLSISELYWPALAAMDSTHVAFIDKAINQLRMYVWSGSTWSQEGTGLSIPVEVVALAAMDSTHVAFIDSNNDQLRMYKSAYALW